MAAANKEVHVIVCYNIAEGKDAAFLEAMKPLVTATNKEKGCIKYNIHKDQKVDNRYVMIEKWDNQENLTKHLKQPHLKTYREAVQKNDIFASPPAVYFCGGPKINLQ